MNRYAFFEAMQWGLALANRVMPPREALDLARFGFAGCIDAPDAIPAGGVRAEPMPDGSDDTFPSPIEIERE